MAAAGEELIVGALLDDFSGGKYDNSIGVFDGRESMGNYHSRSIPHKLLESYLNLLFRKRIHACGGLIEDE